MTDPRNVLGHEMWTTYCIIGISLQNTVNGAFIFPLFSEKYFHILTAIIGVNRFSAELQFGTYRFSSGAKAPFDRVHMCFSYIHMIFFNEIILRILMY